VKLCCSCFEEVSEYAFKCPSSAECCDETCGFCEECFSYLPSRIQQGLRDGSIRECLLHFDPE